MSLDDVIEDVDMVLVMSVNPGFGGQSFIESTCKKIAKVKALCDEHGVNPVIEVDGGINAHNAYDVARAGATMLVAGSSVFNAQDRSAAIEALRSSAQRGALEAKRA